MNVAMIFTAAVAVYALLLALKNCFHARKRSWIMAVVRLGVTVASAVVAVPLTKLAADMGADLGYSRLPLFLGDGIMSMLSEVPVGAEGIRVVAALVVSPLLYLLIFWLVRWVLSIAVWIVEKCIPLLKRRTLKILSMPLGAVNGILVAVVTLIPLCGYMVFGAHILNTVVDSGLADASLIKTNVMDRFGLTSEELEDVADGLEEHPVVSVIHGTVGEPIYTVLTTAELDVSDTHGVALEMNLERELSGFLVMASHAMEVMESFDKEDYTSADKEALFATADSFFGSEWVKMLATDTLVAMSDTWLQNRSFAGMSRPSLDASLNPTMNRLLEVLAAETGETLEEDIHLILDVVGDLLVHDLLEEEADYTAMVQRMGQSGLLTDMLTKLEANERMAPLASELQALSIRLVSNMLGVDKLQSGEYAEMMGNVATTLTDSLSMTEAERDAMVLESVKTNFAGQGYDVPDDVALKMSHQMIDELGGDGVITEEELTDYLVNHADEGFEIVGDSELPAA